MTRSNTTFFVVCEGCGTWSEDEDTGEMLLEDVKMNACRRLGNAELLRDIHDHKTNHRPYVLTEVREETGDGTEYHDHVPPWAEGGWLDGP